MGTVNADGALKDAAPPGLQFLCEQVVGRGLRRSQYQDLTIAGHPSRGHMDVKLSAAAPLPP